MEESEGRLVQILKILWGSSPKYYGRYISLYNASRDTFKPEKLHKTQPVQKLVIHLPNQQPCILRNNDYVETIGTNMEYQHAQHVYSLVRDE